MSRRPDVLGPFPPRDLGDVSDRLHYPHSLRGALYDLPQPCVEVLSTLLVFESDGMSRADLAATLCLAPDDAHLDAALRVCADWAVVWELDGRLHVPGSLRSLMPTPLRLGPPVSELLSPRPVDDLRARADALGLPTRSRKAEILQALEDFYADGGSVRELWAAAPDDQRELLTVAAWSHPVLQHQMTYSHPGRPDPAIAYLLANGLVIGDWQSVLVPREVGLAIRGDDWHPTLSAKPEVTAPGMTGIATAGALTGVTLLAAMPVPQETADQDAAAAANAAIEHVSALVDACGVAPAALLKSGGVGVRELRRLAKAAGLSDGAGVEGGEVRLWIELAFAAHLLDVENDLLLPTPEFDEWRALPPAERLTELLRTWLALPTIPLMEGQPSRPALITIGYGSSGQGAHAYGSSGYAAAGYGASSQASSGYRSGYLSSGSGPAAYGSAAYGSVGSHLRGDVLVAATEWPPGTAFATISDLHAIVRWRRPIVAASLADAANAVNPIWAEARLLGIVGRDTLSSLGRALIGSPPGSPPPADQPTLAQVASAFVHPPSAEAIFQADLTVVVPGSPSAFVSGLLDTVGDRESRGAASTWRLSPASVRRALDGGGTADAVIRELRGIAAGGLLPQPLEYLVTDVARRHGTLRVRTVGCVLRADDPALVAEIVAARALASLGLSLLAPNVLASAAPMDRTLAALRAAGYAPIGEDVDGNPLIERPASRRTTDHRRPGRKSGADRLGDARDLADDGFDEIDDEDYDDDGTWNGTHVPAQTRNASLAARSTVATSADGSVDTDGKTSAAYRLAAKLLATETDYEAVMAARREVSRNLGVPPEPKEPPRKTVATTSRADKPSTPPAKIASARAEQPADQPVGIATLRTVHTYAPQLSPGEQRLLAAAIDAERPVWIQYAGLDGKQTRRIIEPTELDGTIVVAWCRLRDDERNFALSRIRAVTPV